MMSQRLITQLQPEQLASLYLTAKEKVIEAGFSEEIDWQEEVSIEYLDEPTFLSECAWVVLSTGFRESVLRHRYYQISKAFLHFINAEMIIAQRENCRTNALAVFKNQRKIDAVLEITDRVLKEGIETIKYQIICRGTDFLEELPYIGPITACHLAKNIGIPVVKPDRHLTRFAKHTGYETADRMCKVISDIVGDSLSVIDVVLWRYATIIGNANYKNL